MSVNTKMTALADEIRTLSGTTDKLGLDAMKSNVNEANGEIEGQEDLIAQISAALEGKATGGGSSSGIQLVNGTFTVESAVTGEGSTAATITGLPFAPKTVWINVKGVISAYGSSSSPVPLISAKVRADGTTFNSFLRYITGQGVVYTNETNKNFVINLTDDGFSLNIGTPENTNYNYCVTANEYEYLAIG